MRNFFRCIFLGHEETVKFEPYSGYKGFNEKITLYCSRCGKILGGGYRNNVEKESPLLNSMAIQSLIADMGKMR